MTKQKSSIKLVGLGPGNPAFIFPAYKDLIKTADIILGGKRQLDLILPFLEKKTDLWLIDRNFREVLNKLKNLQHQNIVIVASGDPGFFGILNTIKKYCSEFDLEVYPNISSAQWALAKLGWSWEEVKWFSIHGRELHTVMQSLPSSGKIGILTDPRIKPQQLATELKFRGWSEADFILARNLTLPDEELVIFHLEELANLDDFKNDILLAYLPQKNSKFWPYQSPGIPEHLFITGKPPITKAETRALIISKSYLEPGLTIWEIGTGTGSITIEAALFSPGSQVYTADPRPESEQLLKANQQRFNCNNIHFYQGFAPEICHSWPSPHRVIIGGHGGKLDKILEYVHKRLLPAGRLVISATQLKTTATAWDFFHGNQYQEIEAIQLQVNRMRSGPGCSQLWDVQNPCFIISGRKKSESD